MNDAPDPAPNRRMNVLLVMPPGPGRRSAGEALRGAGYRVRTAREPYEGTARFVERPADLVVLSLERFRKRDTAFIATVKRRAPGARVLLLVPEGRRAAAVTALRAGADAYAPEPFYPDELTALASALLADRAEDGASGTAARAIGRLAGEVAHAINNPLQILALLGEAEEVPDQVRSGLGAEVQRIQAVVEILGRYGLLRRPQCADEPLGPLLQKSLVAAEDAGLVRTEGPAPHDGPAAAVDSSQASVAFESMLTFLASRGAARPVPVASRVRAVPESAPRRVEASVRGRGVHLDEEALDALRESVLLTQDETREVYPGLALPAAIARNHGGDFLVRPSRRGTVLALRLPLPRKPS
jgi:DNA-binding NarL/FixJ family response regulator